MINHVSDLFLRGTVLDNSSLLEELRSCYMVYFINFTRSGSRGLEPVLTGAGCVCSVSPSAVDIFFLYWSFVMSFHVDTFKAFASNLR